MQLHYFLPLIRTKSNLNGAPCLKTPITIPTPCPLVHSLLTILPKFANGLLVIPIALLIIKGTLMVVRMKALLVVFITWPTLRLDMGEGPLKLFNIFSIPGEKCSARVMLLPTLVPINRQLGRCRCLPLICPLPCSEARPLAGRSNLSMRDDSTWPRPTLVLTHLPVPVLPLSMA